MAYQHRRSLSTLLRLCHSYHSFYIDFSPQTPELREQVSSSTANFEFFSSSAVQPSPRHEENAFTLFPTKPTWVRLGHNWVTESSSDWLSSTAERLVTGARQAAETRISSAFWGDAESVSMTTTRAHLCWSND